MSPTPSTPSLVFKIKYTNISSIKPEVFQILTTLAFYHHSTIQTNFHFLESIATFLIIVKIVETRILDDEGIIFTNQP